jgi:hypothetical protein
MATAGELARLPPVGADPEPVTKPAGRFDPWLLAILALSAGLNGWQLTWGLPNGNASWAADAIGPVTALSVARHSFGAWNSGWFYFKYPPAWPLLMVAACTPYLVALYASGGWRHPSSEYPYGFADPERALFVLSVIGRLLSVVFCLGSVALAYAIGRRLIGRAAARWCAFWVATAYPFIFYAHTTNLECSYCFWLLLALYCAIAASESDRRLPWIGLGAAAAMAVSTKEQGFAFLLPLPCIALAIRIRQRGRRGAGWPAALLWMIVGGGATLLVAGNVLVNPLGFVRRLAYLLGHPLTPIEARLAPVSFALWKGAKEFVYLQQLWDGLSSSLGVPVLALAALGAITVWRRPRAALWLLLPSVAFYYLALRGLELITLRYLLPITALAAVLAGGCIADLWTWARHPLARRLVAAAAVALAALVLVRAVEVDWLLSTDSRYAAEAWLSAHAPPGARAEVYQKAAFLPRFGAGVSQAFIPLSERTRAGVLARQPDVIVISSASRKSITHRWATDWRATGELLTAAPPAVDMLNALDKGELPYHVAAVLRQQPRVLRNRITSLAPEITIYVRNQ